MKSHIIRAAAVLLTIPAMIFATACNQNTIAALANVLGTSAANIANLEGNSSLATKLTTDTAAAVTGIENWKSGTPAQDVTEALNLVADDLSLFPVADKFAPLVDLAIGTVDSILALMPQPAATPALQTRTAHVASARRHVTLPAAPKTASDYKRSFNAIAKGNGLTEAQIK